MFDVAIVGGGPAGLAAAVAAKRALGASSPRTDPRVAVFERSPSPDPPRGAVLAVVPNGVKALHAIDPLLSKRVLELDLGVKGVRAELKTGEVLFEDASGRRADRTKHLGPSSLCTWHSLRRTLLERAVEVGVEVYWGSSFEGYEDAGEEVELRFSPSSTSSSPSPPSVVSAKVLVGADGSRSRVREQIMRERSIDGDEPSYSGTAAWRGVLRPLPPSWDTSWGWRAFVGSSTDAGAARVVTYPVPLRKMAMADGNSGDDEAALVWQIFARFPESRLSELSSRLHYASDTSSSSVKKVDRALAALGEGWPQELTSAVSATDASSVAEHGLFFREADECIPWGNGKRATLVGDAAHLGTPLLGQGSSAAFEDALALGRELKNARDLDGDGVASLLRRYEESRKPRATAIQRASVEMYKRQGRGERVDEIGEHLELGFMEVEFDDL